MSMSIDGIRVCNVVNKNYTDILEEEGSCTLSNIKKVSIGNLAPCVFRAISALNKGTPHREEHTTICSRASSRKYMYVTYNNRTLYLKSLIIWKETAHSTVYNFFPVMKEASLPKL